MTARRIFIFLLYTVTLVLWHSADVVGQPGGGPPGNPGNPDVPITGLEFLIGGGLFYGIRSLLKARKKNSD
jgi:hypothetical protein